MTQFVPVASTRPSVGWGGPPFYGELRRVHPPRVPLKRRSEHSEPNGRRFKRGTGTHRLPVRRFPLRRYRPSSAPDSCLASQRSVIRLLKGAELRKSPAVAFFHVFGLVV